MYYPLFNFPYPLFSWNCSAPTTVKYILLLMFYNFLYIAINDLRGWFSFLMYSRRSNVLYFTYVEIALNSLYMTKFINHFQELFTIPHIILSNFGNIS